MIWNKLVQAIARLTPFGRNVFLRLLLPSLETHAKLFGRYKFDMDLSLGYLQRYLFLFPDSYEVKTQMLLRQLLKPGMVVFDIGANVGFLTVLMASLVGNGGRVYSFEPYQPNFDLLKHNIEVNSFYWVEPYLKAISDKEGPAILNINPINDGGHSLGDFANNPDLIGWDRNKLRVPIETTTLDNFVKKSELVHIDLIKVDVEGAESLIFLGAKKLLSKKDAPMVICEVGNKAQEQFGKTEKDLRQLLYSYGYRSYFIDRNLIEFGIEKSVKGLINVFFRKY